MSVLHNASTESLVGSGFLCILLDLMIKALSLIGSESSTAPCPHFLFTPDISLPRARPVCLNLGALLLSSGCKGAWKEAQSAANLQVHFSVCTHTIF